MYARPAFSDPMKIAGVVLGVIGAIAGEYFVLSGNLPAGLLLLATSGLCIGSSGRGLYNENFDPKTRQEIAFKNYDAILTSKFGPKQKIEFTTFDPFSKKISIHSYESGKHDVEKLDAEALPQGEATSSLIRKLAEYVLGI